MKFFSDSSENGAAQKLIKERDISVGDTVYALHLMGRKACCEAPAELFCSRNDELTVVDINIENNVIWYSVKLKRGTGQFQVRFRDITKMKPFAHNYSDIQKDWDAQREREYRKW